MPNSTPEDSVHSVAGGAAAGASSESGFLEKNIVIFSENNYIFIHI